MASIHNLFPSASILPWLSVLILALAPVFLIVGLLRVVEFNDLGLKPWVRRVLIFFHVIGCFLFSAALALLALDVDKTQVKLMSWLLFPALGILLPVHIYLGLKRRIKLSQSARD